MARAPRKGMTEHEEVTILSVLAAARRIVARLDQGRHFLAADWSVLSDLRAALTALDAPAPMGETEGTVQEETPSPPAVSVAGEQAAEAPLPAEQPPAEPEPAPETESEQES